jgi:hypothetical protein
MPPTGIFGSLSLACVHQSVVVCVSSLTFPRLSCPTLFALYIASPFHPPPFLPSPAGWPNAVHPVRRLHAALGEGAHATTGGRISQVTTAPLTPSQIARLLASLAPPVRLAAGNFSMLKNLPMRPWRLLRRQIRLPVRAGRRWREQLSRRSEELERIPCP